jgi:hypothetical protein
MENLMIHRKKKGNYDIGFKVNVVSYRTMNRKVLLIAILPSLLLLIQNISSQSHIAVIWNGLLESKVTERFLLSKAVPFLLKECENPLAMALSLSLPSRQPLMAFDSIPLPRNKSRVCIIVVTYNVVDYVSIAIKSLLQQTYVTAPPGPNTTTPTLQVVRLTHITNGGIGQPSNIGIDSCSEFTNYVMFANVDYYLEHDAVETMLKHAHIFNSDIVMAGFDIEIPLANGTVISKPSYDFTHWNEIPNDAPFNILTHPRVLRTSPVPWRKMYKREMLMKYDLKFPE